MVNWIIAYAVLIFVCVLIGGAVAGFLSQLGVPDKIAHVIWVVVSLVVLIVVIFIMAFGGA